MGQRINVTCWQGARRARPALPGHTPTLLVATLLFDSFTRERAFCFYARMCKVACVSARVVSRERVRETKDVLSNERIDCFVLRSSGLEAVVGPAILG